MFQQEKHLYEFDRYKLDVKNGRLLRDGKQIKLQPKAFDILVLLVANANNLVAKDLIIEKVWPDRIVEEGNVATQVTAIRQALGRVGSLVENVPTKGYRFNIEVRIVDRGVIEPKVDTIGVAQVSPLERPQSPTPFTHNQEARNPASVSQANTINPQNRARWLIVSLSLLGLSLLLGYWAKSWRGKSVAPATETKKEINSPIDDEKIRRTIIESQNLEYTVFCADPQRFEPIQLTGYWLPTENGGEEIKEVEKSIQRLKTNNWHLGPETKAEIFEILEVHIYAPGDSALVRSRERWRLQYLNADGTPVKNKNIFYGPYDVYYDLRLSGGKWLIGSSTTPRPRQTPSPSSTTSS